MLERRFKKRITSFSIYRQNHNHVSPWRSFLWDNINTPYRRLFTGFTVPLSLLTIKAVLFPPLIDHIPAATQRGFSDALISHRGQRRGQHTRTSPPVSPPCLQPLLYTAFLLIPLPAFLQIPSVCLSGSRSAAFPDPEKRRNWEGEEGWSHSPRAWIQD